MARLLLFNPFDHVNKDSVRKRVEKLKKKKAHLSEEEICRLLIKRKCRRCAAVGAITALPGAIPVLGTLVAIIGGTFIDMTAMGYYITEMILEIAVVYNRNLKISGTSREAVWVFVSSVGAGVAGKGLTGLTLGQLSGRVFQRLIERALLSLGIRASQRTILRIIPIIGMIAIGIINNYTCRKVGEYVADYYAENAYADSWEGETIDVEVEVKGE